MDRRVIEPHPLTLSGDGDAVAVAVWAAGVLSPGVGADHFVKEPAWAGMADDAVLHAGPGIGPEQPQGGQVAVLAQIPGQPAVGYPLAQSMMEPTAAPLGSTISNNALFSKADPRG
jgi:hypothetical protein